ncbi:MAG: biopolymer transporter ExbD [Deltaproteobacteria bacterium]|nr:biopolymer transporter ExbD [Deltaproteobacteria bacterium]
MNMIVTGRRNNKHTRPRKRALGVIKADINVTPLVDVVLVLLIIFMVVTPMLSKGVSVDLPITAHHDKRTDDNRDVVVAVTHRGQVFVGSAEVPLERLGETVATERRRHPDKGIFLKGDARIDYGQARRVMEALHRAGIEQIQLGTEESSKGPSSPAGSR